MSPRLASQVEWKGRSETLRHLLRKKHRTPKQGIQRGIHQWPNSRGKQIAAEWRRTRPEQNVLEAQLWQDDRRKANRTCYLVRIFERVSRRDRGSGGMSD
jgi:hypothetical protein